MREKKNLQTAPLLSIGAFARVSGVTVKALRHWDERGLLRAASADAGTGYRRYRLTQLTSVDMLERARDMGLPMAELRALAGSEGLSGVSEIPPETIFQVARGRLAQARERLLRSERYLESAERRSREEAELERRRTAVSDKPARLWHVSQGVPADLAEGLPDSELQKMLSDFLEDLKRRGTERGCDWGLLARREGRGARVSVFIEAGAEGISAEDASGFLEVPAGRFASGLVRPEGPLWPEIAGRIGEAEEGSLIAFHLCGWLRAPGDAMTWEAEGISPSSS